MQPFLHRCRADILWWEGLETRPIGIPRKNESSQSDHEWASLLPSQSVAVQPEASLFTSLRLKDVGMWEHLVLHLSSQIKALLLLSLCFPLCKMGQQQS